MTTRRTGFGLGVALSLASVCFSFTSPAFAQDPAPPPAGDAPAKPADAAAPADAAPAPASPPPAEEPAKEVTKEPEKAPEPTPPTEAAPKTASGTTVEREKTVSAVGLELLPGSAYPDTPTRGIRYGSMWLTFHGLQWPYMPLIEGGPGMRVGISGYVWNDLSYSHIVPGKQLQKDYGRMGRWITEARGLLRVTPTYTLKGGWFAQGEAEMVVHGDMVIGNATTFGTTDDMFVRAGKWNVFDVQVGRFQGWEIANHFGMGLDQNTLERTGAFIPGASVTAPPAAYGLTYFWDRTDYNVGAYAAHIYPTKFLRAELLSHLGAGSGVTTPVQVDVRPSAIFDMGFVKLKAGWEYGKTRPADDKKQERRERNGYGFAAQFVVNPFIEGGLSYARGFEEVLSDKSVPQLNQSGSTWTYGGFLNGSPGYEPLVLGFGAFMTHQENMRYDPKRDSVDTNDQFQIFGAIQYTLWERLYFKFVLSHANDRVESSSSGTFSNQSTGGRFRVMVLF